MQEYQARRDLKVRRDYHAKIDYLERRSKQEVKSSVKEYQAGDLSKKSFQVRMYLGAVALVGFTIFASNLEAKVVVL